MGQVGIGQQREFYNNRWSERPFIAKAAVRRAAAILDLIAQTGLKEPRILDFGCGTGWLASVLSNIGPTTALDLSDEAIRVARKRWPWVDFQAGNALEADLPESGFDLVVSQEVLEHLEDQAGYLERAAALLKPGGFLILTTPNAFVFDRMDAKTRKRWLDQPIENRLRKCELSSLLARRFDLLALGSTTLRYPVRGIFRIVNGKWVRSVLKRVCLWGLWAAFWRNRGYGMHFHVLARKKT